MPTPIGPCTFEQLPESIRKAYLEGRVDEEEGTFYSIDFDLVTKGIIGVILGPVMIFVPALMMFYLNYYLVVKPLEVLELGKKVIADGFWGVVVFVILVAIILGIMVFMGRNGYMMIKEFTLAVKQSKLQKEKQFNYGLLLTKDYLYARLEPEDSVETCLFFPRKNIDEVKRQSVRTKSEKPQTVWRTFIYYHTDDGKKWHYQLNARQFHESESVVNDRIKNWVKYNVS